MVVSAALAPRAHRAICPGAPLRRQSAPMTDAPTDESLMLAYARGDARAFATLYDRHERAVYRYFLRQLRDAQLAQDLLQEAWMAVVRNAASYEPRAKFTTWLYAVAHSKLIDHARAHRATQSLDACANDPDDAIALVDQLADPAAGPEQRAMSRQDARNFLNCVEALPEIQRAAFLLHAEGGLGIDEIANVTGANLETAKSRVRYAMAKLRTCMEGWR